MDRLLDTARTGPLYLRRAEIGEMAVEALRYQEQHMRHCQLHSYVVMPNHVHVLLTPDVPVSKLMHSPKRYTARNGNRILGVTNKPFWQDESYDRLVRDRREFERIKSYIETNPVNAGLVSKPEDFLWSSFRADWQSAAGFQPAPHPPGFEM